jgi:hypothetical protein
MGDASSEQERVLAILPLPKPTDLIEKIEKKHPNVKFLWHTLNYIPGRQKIDAKEIDNDCTSTTQLYRPSTLLTITFRSLGRSDHSCNAGCSTLRS